VRDLKDTPTAELRCDFYDWTRRRRCDQRARWVTHQNSGRVVRLASYYCDTHRPPRAQPLAKPRATKGDHSA